MFDTQTSLAEQIWDASYHQREAILVGLLKQAKKSDLTYEHKVPMYFEVLVVHRSGTPCLKCWKMITVVWAEWPRRFTIHSPDDCCALGLCEDSPTSIWSWGRARPTDLWCKCHQWVGSQRLFDTYEFFYHRRSTPHYCARRTTAAQPVLRR